MENLTAQRLLDGLFKLQDQGVDLNEIKVYTERVEDSYFEKHGWETKTLKSALGYCQDESDEFIDVLGVNFKYK